MAAHDALLFFSRRFKDNNKIGPEDNPSTPHPDLRLKNAPGSGDRLPPPSFHINMTRIQARRRFSLETLIGNSSRPLVRRFVLLSFLLVSAFRFAPGRAVGAGTWAPLANKAPGNIQVMLLLSDGTVMCGHDTTNWWRLSPDTNGNYANGAWSALAPMHDTRDYYSSQVLPDGRVFVAGGEYGTGADKAEIYQPTNNTWSQAAPPLGHLSDTISETLPDGSVLEGFFNQTSGIYNPVSNTWTVIPQLAGQNEASWVKLQDGSILTVDPFGTNSQRFVPSLNRWVPDASVPTTVYSSDGEEGAAFLLPTGKVILFCGTGGTAIYTPWTQTDAGLYTPAGATNAGSWAAGPNIPNSNAPHDAPGAMMANGRILCVMGDSLTDYGNSNIIYEYDSAANSFTQVPNNPIASSPAYTTTLLDLPDGTVLCAKSDAQLYVYTPDGTPLAAGQPSINSVTANGDGSYHVTGTLFNGISEGAAYGDDVQLSTDYPIAHVTNSIGNLQYARTFNWSACNVMTGTNLVTTELTLPAGLLPGSYPLVISANGNNSAPYPITITGTPLPPVAGLAFSSIAPGQIGLRWSPIGLTEAGYVIQRASDGVNFQVIGGVAATVTNYADSTVAPLNPYYYRVIATNLVGLGGSGSVIFAASPGSPGLSSPWQSQDVGAVPGSGASGQAAGVYTIIGSGAAGGGSDQFQYAFQPRLGDFTITARVTAEQLTGPGAMAGVMIRNGLDAGSANALMALGGGGNSSVFQFRGTDGGSSSITAGPGGQNSPLWFQLARVGNTITGSTSTDGATWTQQGSANIPMAAMVYAGLAVSGGAGNLLNTATFDNVTVSGSPPAVSPPQAFWKLSETGGSTAFDSQGGYNGTYNLCVLGQPGAPMNSGPAVAFQDPWAGVNVPPLNLNSNALTITAWVNPGRAEAPYSGVFMNDATASGIIFGSGNRLGYLWNYAANNSSSINFQSGPVAPTVVS